MKFNLINQTLDLFYPKYCFVCGEKLFENDFLCEKCKEKIELTDKNICFICGKNEIKNGICDDCKSKYHFDSVFAALKYNPIIKNLMHNFKYAEFKKLANYLGAYLVECLLEYPFISQIDYVIPIPLHKVKKRSRGFNQADLIAEFVANKLNIKFSSTLITRKKFTKSQTKLSKEKRKKNVSGAFCVPNPQILHGKNILLIDDVLTTGSTLSAAVSEILKTGANKIFAATLARA
ncbi:MAG: ComF family protein [Candidatus Cloacimonadota bacterium]|nr:ComF family protein [Candidatus Cloacimonadota bacterium]